MVLGISVWTAAKDALRYSESADYRNFKLPATNEEILLALGEDI